MAKMGLQYVSQAIARAVVCLANIVIFLISTNFLLYNYYIK